MFQAIWRGFASLTTFHGRDTKAQFWPYAIFVALLALAGMAILIVPLMAEAFERMARFAAEHPEQAEVTAGPGSYSIRIKGDHPELLPDFRPFLGATVGGMAAIALLLAAAAARRLHDSGRSGAWGLLPVPFALIAPALFPRLMSGMQSEAGPPLPLFFGLFINNVLYVGSLVLLIFLLGARSNPGPNRFGPPAAT